MEILTVLVFTFGLATSYAAKCENISGTWQNELGSWMTVYVDASNRISGEYHTAVESKQGAAELVSDITGTFLRQSDGALLAFSVLFNYGWSLASWVGQCMVCDDKEVLYTTYTFRRYAPEYIEKWITVVVNQNTFRRIEDQSENNEISAPPRFTRVKTLSTVSSKKPGGLDLNGKWISSNNEEFEIFEANGENVLQGKRHATDLIGRKDGNDMFTAVTLMSASNKRMKSWTGYIQNSESIPQTLETSWLEHEFNPNCLAARNTVRFGTQNFTRTATGPENVKKSETFLDKIRKFFSTMF